MVRIMDYGRQTMRAREPEAPEAPSVLVIDDNALLTKALSSILERAGYRPAICHTGAEALAYIEGNTPAAAVVDIHLPDISGLVLSSKLRERFGPVPPIIVLSGDTSMENIRTLPHVGATYFISKPFHSDYLLQRLRELIAM
jgi:DNA-binding response OmpR family regulator